MTNTLCTGGFDLQKPGGKPWHVLRDNLHTAFENGSGLIGFGKTPPTKDERLPLTQIHLAPFVAADADDTAKGLTALKMLGTFVSAETMVKEYEGDEYFKTYHGERNSSFSTNCNVLMALLTAPSPMEFKPQIEKIVRYLCKSWEERGSGFRDKWVHASAPYPSLHKFPVI